MTSEAVSSFCQSSDDSKNSALWGGGRLQYWSQTEPLSCKIRRGEVILFAVEEDLNLKVLPAKCLEIDLCAPEVQIGVILCSRQGGEQLPLDPMVQSELKNIFPVHSAVRSSLFSNRKRCWDEKTTSSSAGKE